MNFVGSFTNYPSKRRINQFRNKSEFCVSISSAMADLLENASESSYLKISEEDISRLGGVESLVRVLGLNSYLKILTLQSVGLEMMGLELLPRC
jgi:hypothetical protein